MTENSPTASEPAFPSDSAPSAPLVSPTVSPTATGRWPLAVFIGVALAWVLLNFTPIQFHLPRELYDVDNMSPPDLQRQLAEKQTELYWKNSISKLTFAGLGLGLIPWIAVGWTRDPRQRSALVGSAMLGPVFGLLAALLGLGLRYLMSPDGPLSQLAEGDQVLIGDVLVFVGLSLVLAAPISIGVCWLGGEQAGQRSGAVLLAALLAGVLLPVASVAFPGWQTSRFPPDGVPMTGLWFLLMAAAISFLPSKLGAKPPKPPKTPMPPKTPEAPETTGAASS
jgi:hypothetical protein